MIEINLSLYRRDPQYGANLIPHGPDSFKVGKHTYGAPQVHFFQNPAERIEIGSYCSISAGVSLIAGGEHRTQSVATFPIEQLLGTVPFAYTKGPVIIGNDVWIGTNAIILSGVTVGHGAVIGAGAVVSKNVPPYAIVVGNPGRVIKYRFDSSTISRLLELAWWDWTDEKIKQYHAQLISVPLDLVKITS